MSASLITLGFYQKRRPAAWMDVRVGARIGVVVGVCLALELGIALAGAGLVARFGLHAMGSFDAQMAAQVQKAVQQSSTPVPAEMMGFLGSPEFRGGMMLAGFAFLCGGAGGAVDAGRGVCRAAADAAPAGGVRTVPLPRTNLHRARQPQAT